MLKSFLFVIGYFINVVIGEITTVHIIPHSHTDIGWQNTLEGYFYRDKRGGGSSFTQTMGGVNMILTTIIDALYDEPQRKFVWSEMKYFDMWWKNQNDRKK